MLRMGADRNKLVLGLPLYGRIFKLKSTDGVGVQRDSKGEGMQGPYVQEPGFWGYNEVSFCSSDGVSRRKAERESA